MSVRPLAHLTRTDRIAFVQPDGTAPSRPDMAMAARLVGTELEVALRDPDQPVPRPHLVLRPGSSPADLARAGAAIGRAAGEHGPIDCIVPTGRGAALERFAQGVLLGAQPTYRGDPAEIRLWVAGSQSRMKAVHRGLIVGRHVLLARTLGNTPSDIKTPAWLADQAREVTGGKLRVTTRDEQWLTRLGFGGILAVAAGSATEPNLTKLDYRGTDTGPHVVLVGKGITFDSGGLSIKPAASMPMMKTDMAGAAAVIATMAAVRDLALPIRVTGLVACAENMPGAGAARPGDVVRHHGGRTTEVLNTDAEGRLVLADALAYAAARLRPDIMVDLATLTGAATLGLGRQHAPLYATDARLARRLETAGSASGDHVWHMPLVDEYSHAIASTVAQSANTNTDPNIQAGSITAALFLRQFVGTTAWAHLDIAGTGRTESDRGDCRKGATGFGVSLLTQWLSHRVA